MEINSKVDPKPTNTMREVELGLYVALVRLKWLLGMVNEVGVSRLL